MFSLFTVYTCRHRGYEFLFNIFLFILIFQTLSCSKGIVPAVILSIILMHDFDGVNLQPWPIIFFRLLYGLWQWKFLLNFNLHRHVLLFSFHYMKYLLASPAQLADRVYANYFISY